MAYFASVTGLARLAFASTLTLTLGSACGGSSFSNGGEGGDSGSGTSGGSGNHAGTSSTAGKPHAGSSNGGSASGGTGAGGTGFGGTTGIAGGSPGGPECTAPAVSGNCDAYIPAWYHEPSTGLCRPFVYGGCGGNDNRYESLEACQKACPGGNPNYDSCAAPTDCTIGGIGCCGLCDGPGISEHDFIAFNTKYSEVVYSKECGAGDVACAACPPAPLGEGTLKYFVPNCVQGQCVVEDVRTSPVTACKSATDCRLRNGTGCCEGCGGGDYVSVRVDGSFEKLVCGNLQPPCAACEPLPPVDAIAVCDAGHCGIAYVATDTN